MQQIKAQSLNLQNINKQLRCLNNNEAQYLCCNPQCQISAFMCSSTKCICIVDKHEDCSKISAQKIIKDIASKQLLLSKDLQKVFELIDKIYIQMIQKLSEDRQQLALIKQNYGLSFDEAKFLQAFKNRQLDLVNGKNIYKLKNNIKCDNNLQAMTQKKVKQYWQFKNLQFENIIQKIKQIYRNKNYFKQTIFNWNVYGQKSGYQINGLVASKTVSNTALSAVYLEPSLSNDKKSVWGIYIKDALNLGLAFFNQQKVALGTGLNSNLGKNVVYSINYSGSTLQKGLNINNSFYFTNGDTIYIMYDPYQKNLKFNKNLKDGFYIIKNINVKSTYYFQINGLQFGNSVELINQSQVPEIDWNKTKNQVIRPTGPQRQHNNGLFGPPSAGLFNPPPVKRGLFQEQEGDY